MNINSRTEITVAMEFSKGETAYLVNALQIAKASMPYNSADNHFITTLIDRINMELFPPQAAQVETINVKVRDE